MAGYTALQITAKLQWQSICKTCVKGNSVGEAAKKKNSSSPIALCTAVITVWGGNGYCAPLLNKLESIKTAVDTHLPSLCSVTSLAKRKCDGCFSIFDFNWYSLLIVFSSRGCLAKANGLDGKALLGFGVEGPKNWGSIGRGERTIWVKQRIVKQPREKVSFTRDAII